MITMLIDHIGACVFERGLLLVDETRNDAALFEMLRMDKAREKAESEWLFNFTSLATAVVTTPKSNARTLNPATCDYLKVHPGCTGVVMMDFAGDTDVSGDELLRAVIDQNFYCHLPCVR